MLAEKTAAMGKARYFHMHNKSAGIMAGVTLVSIVIGVLAGVWEFGAVFWVVMALLALPEYLDWNREFNAHLKQGKTEAEVRELITGKKVIKVLKVRDPEPADFRRFHFRKKHLLLAIFSLIVSIVIDLIGGAWWAAVPFIVIAGALILCDYLLWNRMVRDWLKMGYTEVEARKVASEINRGAAASADDLFWDPSNSGLPYNAWHKD